MDSLYAIFKACNSISIDSRTTQTHSLFIALTGATHDGHNYIHDAFEKGASYAIIDNPKFNTDSRCILVENTLLTLQDLARTHRKQLTNTTVIAIVGSNGKTTTKELTAAILQSDYRITATRGNFNNHIGLPLTILSITPDRQFAVLEMGANHAGEHQLLCEIAQPQFGIITNCGKDHLEGYGSLSGVINANNELFEYLAQTNGTAFLNQDDATLVSLATAINTICYTHSSDQSQAVTASGQCTQQYPKISLKLTHHQPQKTVSTDINSHLLGSFQSTNILAAACIGLYFNVPINKIKSAIENYVPTNNRSQVISWQDNTVLLDAYNANPSSMSEMLCYFSNYPADQKVIILGDMFELGPDSDKEHQKIIELVKEKNFDQVILVGQLFSRYKHMIDCHHFNDVSQLKQFLNKNDYRDHYFLVKGSRGMALENAF